MGENWRGTDKILFGASARNTAFSIETKASGITSGFSRIFEYGEM
jgi:hypothetical protein